MHLYIFLHCPHPLSLMGISMSLRLVLLRAFLDPHHRRSAKGDFFKG